MYSNTSYEKQVSYHPGYNSNVPIYNVESDAPNKAPNKFAGNLVHTSPIVNINYTNNDVGSKINSMLTLENQHVLGYSDHRPNQALQIPMSSLKPMNGALSACELPHQSIMTKTVTEAKKSDKNNSLQSPSSASCSSSFVSSDEEDEEDADKSSSQPSWIKGMGNN